MVKFLKLFALVIGLFIMSSCSYSTNNSNLDDSATSMITTGEDVPPGENVSSIPQTIIYKNIEYKMITGVGTINMVESDQIGDLLGYLINSNDVEDFIVEFTNTFYVAYENLYDLDTNNRVPFYKVKDDDELNFICCKHVLYQKQNSIIKMEPTINKSSKIWKYYKFIYSCNNK